MRVLDIVKYDLNHLQINSSSFIQYVNTLFFSYTLWDNSSQHNSTWFKELSFIVKPASLDVEVVLLLKWLGNAFKIWNAESLQLKST